MGSGSGAPAASGGERPRLNLARRSDAGKDAGSGATPAATPAAAPAKPKSNPFGSATAVDTSARFAAMELKEKEEKEQKKKEKEEKDAAAAVAAEQAAAEKAEEDKKAAEKAAEELTPEAESKDEKEGDGKDEKKGKDRRERKFIEPKVVNSRAAMFGASAAPKKEELGPERRDRDRRDRRDRDNNDNRGPPPVVNERFAKLAEEEKEKMGASRDRRDRDNNDSRDNNRGPPPVVNERFAKLAEEEKEKMGDRRDRRDRDNNDGDRGDRGGNRWGNNNNDAGPPPMQTNSRFAAVAADHEADRATREQERVDRGPPPQVTNSRFAAVAAENERENEMRNRDREERGGGDRFGRMDDRGGGDRFGSRGGDDRGGGNQFGRRDDDRGPPPVNSRFAALVQGDEDYVPAELRNQRNNERNMEDGGGRFGQQQEGGRFGQQDGGGGFGGQQEGGRFGGGGGRFDDRGGGGSGGRFGDNRGRGDEPEIPSGPRWKQEEAAHSDNAYPPLNKGKVAGILAPKGREEVVLAPVEAPLTLPGEDEAAAKARLEKKRREEEEKAAAERKAAEEAAAKLAAAETEAAEQAAKAAAMESKLLSEFASGNKLGEDLQQWCTDQGTFLPTVEKLLFHLLSEQKSPDLECGWAESDKYGTALVSLVEDKADEQMQVLWAIQKYCETQCFPKINDEYLVQAMFRAMYKFDLTEPDAFDLWKDDESEANSKGKMKAVIQTMDWFTWLEEDDDDDEEEYEEE